MAIWQHWRKGRKITGGKYKKFRDKRKRELGREPAMTKIGLRKLKKVRTFGGNYKLRLLSDEYVNVYIPKEKRTVKAKIIHVKENPANRHFPRMGVITKGAILETDIGLVKVTNRPGQEGVINGILIEGE